MAHYTCCNFNLVKYHLRSVNFIFSTTNHIDYNFKIIIKIWILIINGIMESGQEIENKRQQISFPLCLNIYYGSPIILSSSKILEHLMTKQSHGSVNHSIGTRPVSCGMSQVWALISIWYFISALFTLYCISSLSYSDS